MSRFPKGRRLAVALPPRFPSRSLSLLFASVMTAAYLGPALYFIYGTGEALHRKQAVAVILGAFGLVCVVAWVREFLRWYLAGDTVVEVSASPVAPGQSLQCYVLQDRDHSWIRELKARVVCRRQIHRGILEEVISLPIEAAGAIEREGRRARAEGTVQIPQDAPATIESEPLKIRWSVEVRVVFGRTLVLVEDHPLIVAK